MQSRLLSSGPGVESSNLEKVHFIIGLGIIRESLRYPVINLIDSKEIEQNVSFIDKVTSFHSMLIDFRVYGQGIMVLWIVKNKVLI